MYFQEADIAIGSITITGPRLTAVDFSVPYYETGAGFIANIPRELSKWAALLRPYKFNVWLPLIIAIILSGPVVWLISKQNPRKNIKKISLQKCYDISFKIIVYQGKKHNLRPTLRTLLDC
jgi:ABC-type amino acid transport substrate-binding protein